MTNDELSLRRLAKNRIQGLAYLRRMKIRQRSRLTTIRVGDANTKLFHLRANGRRRKNHIPALNHLGVTHTTHEQKVAVILQHFTNQLGTCQPREHTLNWDALEVHRHDLTSLDNDLSEMGIKEAVMKAPSEKAPMAILGPFSRLHGTLSDMIWWPQCNSSSTGGRRAGIC